MNHKALRKLREEANLSREDLARLTDVSASSISKYEQGLVGNPSFSHVVQLSNALASKLSRTNNTVLTELIGVNDTPEPEVVG